MSPIRPDKTTKVQVTSIHSDRVTNVEWGPQDSYPVEARVLTCGSIHKSGLPRAPPFRGTKLLEGEGKEFLSDPSKVFKVLEQNDL